MHRDFVVPTFEEIKNSMSIVCPKLFFYYSAVRVRIYHYSYTRCFRVIVTEMLPSQTTSRVRYIVSVLILCFCFSVCLSA